MKRNRIERINQQLTEKKFNIINKNNIKNINILIVIAPDPEVKVMREEKDEEDIEVTRERNVEIGIIEDIKIMIKKKIMICP